MVSVPDVIDLVSHERECYCVLLASFTVNFSYFLFSRHATIKHIFNGKFRRLWLIVLIKHFILKIRSFKTQTSAKLF